MKSFIYPWQASTWQAWQKQLVEKRLHHAILYCSDKGSGRLALSAMLAKTLLCTQKYSTQKHGIQSDCQPCLQCHSCQLFDAGTHPDFHHLKSEEAKQLSVEAIRAGNKFAWQTSQLGGVRVILIEDADKMGEAGANALLKTLEEPPQHCYFILVASGLTQLLPTIVSRCNRWMQTPIAETKLKQWIEQTLHRPVSLQSIRLHAGSPLAAKNFIEQEKEQAYNQLLSDFSDFVINKQNLFLLVGQIQKQQKALEWLGLALLDALKFQLDSQIEIVHSEAKANISKIAIIPSSLLFSQLQALNQLNAKFKTQAGLNAELLISHWLTHFIYSEN